MDKLANIIWPPRCFSCGDDVTRQGDVCGDCFGQLRFITDPMCECCGHPFAFQSVGQSLCGDCLCEAPPFDRARSALIYNDKSSAIMLSFKNDQTIAQKRLASWCQMAADSSLDDADFIVPVPLHPTRLRARGYNQAALLARRLSTTSGVPLLVDGLERTRKTPKQQELSRTARQKNVRGAFRVVARNRPLIRGRHVILVDDVLTTGATAKACSKALKSAGAAIVSVVTVTRVVQNEEDHI